MSGGIGQLGKYRLEARLGGGGMAEVFLAQTVGAEGFSRKVAIKRVLPGFSDNPAFAQMFVGEAQISSRMVHPNIVSVLDFDRDAEQRLYLVMELVEGRDLDALVSTGVLPYPLVIYLVAEILRGLGYAHDLPVGTDGMRGIVHRDVSPHNVLLSWEGAVKVSDFGIAKARAASAATASVFIKGKPAYMSPEQANGEQLDGRSDLFAVGVMLWEMLVGRRLFTGDDTRATLAAVLFGQIPRPRTIRGDVPKDLEKVCMKLLERDLPARYPTAEAAIQDLLDCSDAPRDGRALLVKTLAERFPQLAPVRGSQLRSHQQITPPSYMTPTIHATPGTAADGRAGPQGTPPGHVGSTPHVTPQSIPMASLSGMRSAPTGTIGPKKRKLAPVILAIAGLASAGAAFLIVRAVASGHKETSHDAAAPAIAVQPAPPVTHDAAVDAASVPVDAPPVTVVTPDAGPDDKKRVPEQPTVHSPAKQGRLIVHAFPVLTVYLDSKKLRDTPVDMLVPVGKHTLKLVNTEAGKTETVPITISESKPTTIDRE